MLSIIPSQTNHTDWPAGSETVREIPKKGTGWFCTYHNRFIRPNFVRSGKYVYPICTECFYQEVGDLLDVAVEESDVEEIQTVAGPESAIDTSGVLCN